MNPFLSFCVPTHNRAAHLRKCLISLTAEAGNIEVVVNDNASTDQTRQVVEELDDVRIRYRRLARDVGAVANFADAISQARGEYVCVVSDDDWLVPGGSTTLASWLKTNSPSVAKTDLLTLSDRGNVGYLSVDPFVPESKPQDALRRLFAIGYIWTGLCFRRSELDIERFRGEHPRWYPHLLILATLCDRPAHLGEAIFVHRSESELYQEALADSGREDAFLSDLERAFEAAGDGLDADTKRKIFEDAVTRISMGRERPVDARSLALKLDVNWWRLRTKTLVGIIVVKTGRTLSSLYRKIRQVFS